MEKIRRKTQTKRKIPLIKTLFVTLLATVALVAGGVSVAYGAAGDTPANSKTSTPNGDGTNKITLSVTGDSQDDKTEAGKVNVLIIYDESSSMTTNNVTTNPNRNRADYAEDVVHDFIESLRGYQNTSDPSNIEVAVVGFGPTVNNTNVTQSWTSDLTSGTSGVNRYFDDGVNGTTTPSHNYGSHNGTNWEAALQQAQTYLGQADGDPTFVILVTDGACTASGNGNNAINPNTNPPRPWTDFQTFYNAARDEALAIQNRANTTLLGIYAYGTEADLLDDLIYYSNTGSDRAGMDGGTVDTTNYYNASDTSALNEAINDIFNQIVNALGITAVSMSDGTTSNVSTTTEPIELLGVDESTYQYWMDIPLVNNSFKRTKNITDSSGVTRAVDFTYTVSANSDGTCTVTWTDENNTTQSETVKGSVSAGVFKYEWEGETGFYEYAPNDAQLVNSAVKWDLSNVGTLLNGVTYSVSFDVYPSQTAMDYKARLENGEDYEDVVPADARAYFHRDGTLETNTTATLTYSDTRLPNPGPTTTEFENPPAIATTSETMTVEKTWDPSAPDLEDGLNMEVVMDGKDTFLKVNLKAPDWSKSFDVSCGIIRNNTALDDAKGHDFSFAELGSEQYRWELHAPTVRPMLINGSTTPTILIKADAENGYDPAGKTQYTIDGNVYYVDPQVTTLQAENIRRSNLNLTKSVTGDGAPADATFPFTLTVNNSKAQGGDQSDTSSDYYVWFSIYDTVAGATVTNATVSATGLVGPNAEGYYYVPSGTAISVDMKAGWNLRFTNLPSRTTYTFVEDTTAGFKFTSAELTEGEDDNFAGGKTSTGTIVAPGNIPYTVKYTNEYALVDVTATKVWDDNSNQDGKRPETLALTLNGAPTGTTVPEPTITKSSDGNTWTYKWAGLPKYDDEEAVITYSVTEENVPSGYTCETTTVNSGGTITNKHTPETIAVTAKKAWDDASNQDGKRPGTLDLTLNAPDGVTVPDPVITGTDGNEWTYTWSGMPKYQNGTEIAYTVTEETVPTGYTCTTKTVDAGGTITNSYTPEQTTVTVEKYWDDNSDQDGKRPETLELTLNGAPAGTTVPEPTITKSEDGNTWTYTIEGLPVYSGGQLLTYTWTEESIPDGYTCATQTVNSGETITNVHTPLTTSATITKAWDDANNQDGIRPSIVTVQLLANGTAVEGKTVTLSETTEWTATIDNLPMYENKVEIEYTWQETVPEGYEPDANPAANNGTITNKHVPSTITINGAKDWDDADNQDGIRPDTITVNLLANGEKVDSTTATADTSWAYEFANVDEYAAGKKITYTVTEEAIDGYDPVITGYNIKNSHTPDTVEFEVTKKWDDADDQDGKRPESITVNLLADGETIDTQTLSEDNKWYYKWEELDKNKAGNPITYTIEEVKVEGYESTIEGSLITNVHEPEKIEIPVSKEWDDADDQDGARPGSITFNILADGEQVATASVTENDGWTYTFKNLPKYKAGKEIAYTVTEDAVEDYETTVDGYTVTNTHTPEVIDIDVEKVWDDADDRDGVRPASITVNLLADGEVAATATLSEDNGWAYTWEGVAKYNAGKEIGYEVTEDEVAEYTLIGIYGDVENGFTVNNYHLANPDKVMSDPPVQKIVEGEPATQTTFTFQMKAITAGAPMPEGTKDGVKTVQITGTGSYEFGEMYYEEAGTWVYEISEVDDGAEGYTYDTTKYTLTVKVEEVADGSQVKLSKTETVTGGESSSPVFTNKYTAPEEPPVVPQTGDDLGKVVVPVGIIAAASGLLALGLGRKLRKEK